MVSIVERYAAALLGFGFVATALGAGLRTALAAAIGAGAAWWLAGLRQRRRRDRLAAELLDERRDRTPRGARSHARARARRVA
jgi:uncharacterized membrane protein YccC